MTKRNAKTKTRVTYAVQWHDGTAWRSDLLRSEFSSRPSAVIHAREEAQRSQLRHRVMRVERTALEVVTP